MAEVEDNTPKTDTEAPVKAEQQPAVPQQEEAKTAPQPSAGDLDAKPGETLEAYAARIRSEIEWRDKQLGRQQRKLKDVEAQAIRAAEEAQRQPAPPPTPTPIQGQQTVPAQQPVSRSPQVPQSVGETEIRRKILLEQTEERLRRHAEWPAALANFQKAGSIPPEMVDDILATDDPTSVFLALGKDMAKFQELQDMPENRRRAVIYQLGMSLEQKPEPKPAAKRPSEAPAPVQRLQSGGDSLPQESGFQPGKDDRLTINDWRERDKVPDKYASDEYDAEWYAQRAKQKAAARNRPWSFGGKGGAPRN